MARSRRAAHAGEPASIQQWMALFATTATDGASQTSSPLMARKGSQLDTPTYTYPDRGAHKLSVDQWLALKSLGLGYERINFQDGIALTFLGLADGAAEMHRWKLTEDGRKFLDDQGH